MSLAITHFAFGAAATMLVVTFLLPRFGYPRASSVLGGIWAMVPDAHHVSPSFAESLRAVHDSVYANLFWGHRFFDVLDPADSNEVALLSVAFFLAATVVAETAEYYFGTPVQRTFRREARAQSRVSSLGGAFGGGTLGDTLGGREPGRLSLDRPSLVRAVRIVGGALAVVGGVGLHVLLFRTGSHVGLLAGLGALLELFGVVTLFEDAAVAAWVSAHVSSAIRAGARAIVVVAACLLALPLFFTLSTPTTLSVANAAIGALLVLAAIRL
ncbi:hypothetical protein [Halogeometricum sp. CBA1124]|uniref:hypothetical protein n=1 Tax=Halogeometricum sp. CBA1124 TaxID=2668071 RepID=UPI00142AA2B9|nr:hypothetical protein [Halogeometricum sp. CBA1124]MUV57068.1 hypothetical protein [Halogeometricum sp. CBA1124]